MIAHKKGQRKISEAPKVHLEAGVGSTNKALVSAAFYKVRISFNVAKYQCPRASGAPRATWGRSYLLRIGERRNSGHPDMTVSKLLAVLPCVSGYAMTAPASRRAPEVSMKLADDGVLGVGVIGAGRIGLVHLEALSACENAK